MPTVIPWAKRLDLRRRRRRRARAPPRPRRSRPRDWSSGVVGTFAVCSARRRRATASVKVPPTSTPSSTVRTLSGSARGPGLAKPGPQPHRRGRRPGGPPHAENSGRWRRPPRSVERALERLQRAAPARRRSPRGACATGSSRGPAAARAGRACPCGCARGTRGDCRRARRPSGSRSRNSSASLMLRSITLQTRSWSLIGKCTRTSLNSERAGRAK